MAKQIAALLKRGTPVILITGRGSSAKDAANSIRNETNLSFWQIRRLYCVLGFDSSKLQIHPHSNEIKHLAV